MDESAPLNIQLDIKWLRSQAVLIQYFGLGFIQIKLSPTERVHVYSPELPAINSSEEIHNHRYNFLSKILQGTLKSSIFEFIPADKSQSSHRLTEESCRPDTPPWANKELFGNVRLLCKFESSAGARYSLDKDSFHVVSATENCITHLKRATPSKEYAQVIRPIGTPSMCPFGKKVSEDLLWQIVERAIK